jgi:protein-histidine pros-kinase
MAVPEARAGKVRNLFLLTYVGVFAVLAVLMNLLLGAVVIQPINRIAAVAESVSLGDSDAPEFHWKGRDEVARLATSFNRMRRSLQEALRMLDEK